MSRVLVTGADGFVGRAMCEFARVRGLEARRTVRRLPAPEDALTVAVGSIGPSTDWGPSLEQVDAVIHLAGRAHVMRERSPDPLAAFRTVNVEGTRALAVQAAAAGVRRLVFVSSIKVNGERTGDRPFSEGDPPAPVDPYGRSKLEAEQVLRAVGARTGLEVVIVRPPLVHGPGVGGNLRRLLGLLSRGIPLPFAAIDNRRSLLGVGNLTSLLLVAAYHPRAAGETFLVADEPAIATPRLLELMAKGLGRPARLFPVPPVLLRLGATLTGRSSEFERLTGSLVVDSSRARTLLDWEPPMTLEEGLAAMTEAYRRETGMV